MCSKCPVDGVNTDVQVTKRIWVLFKSQSSKNLTSVKQHIEGRTLYQFIGDLDI